MRKLSAVSLGCLLLAQFLVGELPAQSKKAQDLIKELTQSKNPKARAGAAQDLGNLAEIKLADAQAAVPALRAAQKDPDPGVRKAALDALRKIETDPKEQMALLLDALKKDKDPDVRLAIVTTLGQMGKNAKEAVPALREVQSSLLATQKNTDAKGVRKAIVETLGRIDPDPKAFIPVLTDVLRKDGEPNVRLTAVNALGRLGPKAKEAFPVLIEAQKSSLAANKDKDPQGVRKAIVEALPKLDSANEAYVPNLLDTLKKDRNPEVRLAAVTAVGRVNPAPKTAVPLLIDVHKTSLLASPMTDQNGLRKATLETLAKLEAEPKVFVPLLVETLQRDRDPDVRLAAVAALGKIGPPAKAAMPVLTAIQKSAGAAATDKDKELVKEAGAALQKIQGKGEKEAK